MKHLVMAAVFLTVTVSSAMAAGPYIGGSAGLSIFRDSDLDGSGFTDTLSYDPGPSVNVLGGYNFGGFRLEGEYGYKHANVRHFSGFPTTGMDTAIHSVMANMFYDFTPKRVATPVVGLGLGGLFGDFSDTAGTYHDTKPGYQMSVGVAFNLGKSVNLDLSYRLQGSIGDFKVAASNVSYLSSNFLVGARYNF